MGATRASILNSAAHLHREPDFAADEVMDIPETARAMNACRSTVYAALAGDLPGLPPLPSIKLGRRRLIRRESLRNWLAAAERGSIK